MSKQNTKKHDTLIEQLESKLNNLGLRDAISQVVMNDDKLIITIECSKDEANIVRDLITETEQTFRDAGVEAQILMTSRSAPKQEDRRMPVKGVKKVILVASGKGGVGKSTIAFNLAITLARKGKKVGLVDVDIYGPSLPALSGLTQKPVLESDMMIPHKKYGIKLMSVGYLVDGADALIWRGPMTTKMLYQLIRMTNWAHDSNELDYLIIDTPPGTGDVHLSLAENYKIDGAIVVSTPQELVLTDVKRALTMFQKLSIPVLGIVENFSYMEQPDGKKLYIFGGGKPNEKLAKQFGTTVMGSIPMMTDLNDSCASGKPITFFDVTHPVSQIFEEIAESC